MYSSEIAGLVGREAQGKTGLDAASGCGSVVGCLAGVRDEGNPSGSLAVDAGPVWGRVGGSKRSLGIFTVAGAARSIKLGAWWAVWALIHAGRAGLVVLWLTSSSPLGWVLGCLEGLSVVFSICNIVTAGRVDQRFVGFLLPLCYLMGFLLLPPMGAMRLWVVLPVWGWSVILVAWALLCLGRRYTAAFAAFHSVCDWGPYAWVRHPQAAGRILVIYSVAVSGVNYAGIVQCVACLAFVFVGMMIEESFLGESPEYADYAERVPFRLWWGVW